MKSSQYYEGILQLRNPNKKVRAFVKNQIDKKEGVFISKIVKVRNGFDYYISSNRFLKNLGYKLREQFGGELKMSSKLYSRDRQTSKELHRLNVLYRCCDFKRGSIIEVRGEKIKVVGLGKRVQGKRLKDGKRIFIDFKELR